MAENKEKPKTVAELTAENELLKRQIAELQAGKAPVDIKGFLLDAGDPFGDGAIRAYRKAGGKSKQADRLPFVLPEKDDASNAAIASYIQRADAAGDKARVSAARKILPAQKKIA